jgi:hypothetical protein
MARMNREEGVWRSHLYSMNMGAKENEEERERGEGGHFT